MGILPIELFSINGLTPYSEMYLIHCCVMLETEVIG